MVLECVKLAVCIGSFVPCQMRLLIFFKNRCEVAGMVLFSSEQIFERHLLTRNRR